MTDRVSATDDTVAAGLDAPSLPNTAHAEDEAPLLAGRYRVLALLGSGGMGSVYRARDVELDEQIALKVLRRELVADASMLGRFRQEVKLARRVTHRNVARTFDIGEHPTGGGTSEKFLTMELVDGPSLARLLEVGPLPIARAIAIGKELASGIDAAHAAGVLHRDLKPDNVLIESSGRTVITDFGIARGVVIPHAQATGELIGTPAYMAPEQVEGRVDLDARVDLYALGEILFEMVSGARAWPGDNPFAVASARLLRPPPDPRAVRGDVPAPLADLIVRCLARDRDQRPASAREILDALSAIEVGPMSLPSLVPPPAPRNATSLAVLPLRSAESEAYLADGFVEDLIDALSTTPSLLVRPRSMVFGWKGKEEDPRAIGRELGVDAVVEGALRRAGEGDGVRVTLRLLTVADGFQIWSHRLDTRLSALLGDVDATARALGDSLTARVQVPARAGAVDSEAIDLYLRARAILRRNYYGTIDDGAAELLERAVARAPDEPTFLAALATARSRFVMRPDLLVRAREAADRAVAVAPHHGESWLALAVVRHTTMEGEAEVRALARALAASPNLAKAHHLVGAAMYEVGYLREAVERCTRALALDPELQGPSQTLATIHTLLGDDASVEAILEHPTMRAPATRSIGIASRARRAIVRGERLKMAETLADLGDGPPAIVARTVSRVASGAGLGDEGRQFFADVSARGMPAMKGFFAQIRVELMLYLDRTDEAFAALDEAIANGVRDLAWIDGAPIFRRVQGDSRLAAARAGIAANAAPVLRALAEEGLLPAR